MPEYTVDEINKIQSDAVMHFVNTQVGAFETGFVEGNEVSLYSLYRFAQLHALDNYKVEIKNMNEAWGEETTKECRNKSEK